LSNATYSSRLYARIFHALYILFLYQILQTSFKVTLQNNNFLLFFSKKTSACNNKTFIIHREYSNEWWFWLIASGVSLGLTISVKMVGLFTVMTIGVAVLIDLWNLLDIERGLSMVRLLFVNTVNFSDY